MSALVVVILKEWKLSLIALLLLICVSLSFYSFSLNKNISYLEVSHEKVVQSLELEYSNTARIMEQEDYAEKIEAINEYKQREEVILADVAAANLAVTSLSNTLTEVSAAAKLNAELGSQYIDTSARIIEECTAEYRAMGEITSRLASEVKLLTDGNF